MTGHAEIVFDRPDVRLWKLRVNAWQEAGVPPTFHWDLLERSPYNP